MNSVVEYCSHYDYAKLQTEIEHPLISNDPKVYIKDDWERAFIEKFTLDEKCELLQAANFFNIPALFELCAASIAAYFKGKEFDKIKHEFGLSDVNYTPEDEE